MNTSNKNQFETYRYTRVDDGPYSNQYPSIAWYFNVDYDKEVMKFTMARCSERDNFSRNEAKKYIDRRLLDEDDVFYHYFIPGVPLVVQAVQCLNTFKQNAPEHGRTVSGLVKRVLEDYVAITNNNN